MCQSGCGGAGDTALPLSGRCVYETLAGADDEYFKRWQTCGQHGGFSGVYDYARAGGKLCGRAAHMRGDLPQLKENM